LDNQIWKWFVIFYFSGNWNGNHTIEINYYFFESEFKKQSLYMKFILREAKSSMQKSLSQ
jgi:hypothetical protein